MTGPSTATGRRVVVIGGGIVGVATAFHLAAAGANTTLVEATRLGGGTSTASFAWVNAYLDTTLDYHRLRVSAMAEYNVLRRRLGGAPWLHLDGHAHWALSDRDADEVDADVRRSRAMGYPAEWLTRAEFGALEPAVSLPPSVERVAFFPTEGYVETAPLIDALAGVASGAGLTIRHGFRVENVEQHGEHVTGVVGGDGHRIPCDAVVICAGPRSAEVGDMLGVTIPLANVAGCVMTLTGDGVDLQTTITTRHVNIRPDGARHYCVQAPDLDPTVSIAMPAAAQAELAVELMARAARIVPGLAAQQTVRLAIGVRPMPRDELPLVGPIPGVGGAYLVVTHSGVTLGPLLGRLAAQEITTGVEDARLAPFRPSRLIESVSPH